MARTTLPLSRNASARMRCQCITVTANTTMMAALSEPMTANGTSSLRYRIATPAFELLRKQTMATRFGSAGTPKSFLCQRGTICSADVATVERASLSACGLLPNVGTIAASPSLDNR
jgi:hypothetical protein